MNLFLTALVRFLSLLPFGNADKRKKNLALKKIFTRLKLVEPPFYHPYTDILEPAVFSAMFRVLKGSRLLQSLLNQSVMHENAEVRRSFADALVTERLNELKLDYRKFSQEGMGDILSRSVDYGESLKILDNDFMRFLETFQSAPFKAFDSAYDNLLQLVNICQFDFTGFIGKSKKEFDEISRNQTFLPVPGTQVKTELEDLYFLIGGFTCSADLQRNIRILSAAVEIENKDEMYDASNVFGTVLCKELNAGLLKDILQVIEQDPFLEPKYEHTQNHYLQNFIDRAKTRYNEDKAIILEEIHMSKLNALIEKLFREPLALVPGYTREKSELFQSKGLMRYSHVTAMQVLKSFTLAYYDGGIAEMTGKILTGGEFLLESFRGELSNIHQLCSFIKDNITKFETELDGADEISNGEIMTYIKAIDEGTDESEGANRIIRKINEKAMTVLKDNTEILNRLRELIKVLLEDSRMKQPTIIGNIRVIAGSGSARFLDSLATAYKHLVTFIEIMENFTIVKKPKVY